MNYFSFSLGLNNFINFSDLSWVILNRGVFTPILDNHTKKGIFPLKRAVLGERSEVAFQSNFRF